MMVCYFCGAKLNPERAWLVSVSERRRKVWAGADCARRHLGRPTRHDRRMKRAAPSLNVTITAEPTVPAGLSAALSNPNSKVSQLIRLAGRRR